MVYVSVIDSAKYNNSFWCKINYAISHGLLEYDPVCIFNNVTIVYSLYTNSIIREFT